MKKAERAPEAGNAADAAGMLKTAWDTAKSLFDYRKAEETLMRMVGGADIRTALIIFAAATILGAVISLVIYAETLYFAAFTYKALTEVVGGLAPEPDYSSLGPFAVFLLLTAPVAMLVSFCQDGIVYYLLRFTGGKGTFTRQYYLSSFVALAAAMSSAIMVLGPVPCLGAPAVLAYVVMTFYFMFVVRCRAYATLHDLTYLHVLLMVFISCIPAVLVLLYTNGAAANALNIPQSTMYNLTNMTNVSGV